METEEEKKKPHHGHRVQLLQGVHGPEQNDHDATSLDRLNRPSEQVRRERFKVL